MEAQGRMHDLRNRQKHASLVREKTQGYGMSDPISAIFASIAHDFLLLLAFAALTQQGIIRTIFYSI